jgi:hypothetical protein
MMTDITARAGDGELVIEVSAGGRTQNTSLTEKVTTKAADAMQGARQTVIRVAEEFVSAVDAMETKNRPSEMAVQFGIALTVTGTAKVASAQSAANFTVTLKYDLAEKNGTATSGTKIETEPEAEAETTKK